MENLSSTAKAFIEKMEKDNKIKYNKFMRMRPEEQVDFLLNKFSDMYFKKYKEKKESLNSEYEIKALEKEKIINKYSLKDIIALERKLRDVEESNSRIRSKYRLVREELEAYKELNNKQ